MVRRWRVANLERLARKWRRRQDEHPLCLKFAREFESEAALLRAEAERAEAESGG